LENERNIMGRTVLTVYLEFLGDGFVALDQQGVQITDPEILYALAFEPLPADTRSVKLLVDTSTKPVIITPLQVNINTNIHTQR
jgi:hypothetical protein